ncbi:A24 family peptidase [Faunimonas sp. B44]|uniref:A24 family peptidase n=1 Tax=Faunimonas sp. B44 TaxID=3461493 RepID=UPI0040444AFB
MTVSDAALVTASLLFPGAMIYAGIMDLVTMKIRNGLVLFVAAAYFVLAPLAGFGAAEIGLSAILGLAVFVVTFVLFALGWIGGGDAKLAAATALWFGPEHALTFFTYMALLGGLLTLAIIQLRAWPLPSPLSRIGWLSHLHAPKTGIPYGAAMAPAALIVFPNTDWMNAIL